MAAHKGHPKSGGRTKGTPNKQTADVKALAREYGPTAIAKLAYLVEHAESDAAKVSAIKELLDRAYGKATMPIQHSGDAAQPIRVVFETVYERKPD